MSSIFPNLIPFQLFMSEDVAVTAQTLLNGTPPNNHFRKEWLAAAGTTPTNSAGGGGGGGGGGQMMTLSPPAGDGPGSAGSTAPESTSSLSDLSGDAEGVWSIDIDQAFQEALAIYPPCGRRKIIISDEGKMYGRNELIARYIKLRCGKTRTRKQVSSHIQVLARKKLRDEQAKKKGDIPSLLQQCSPPGLANSPPSSLPSVPSAAVVAAAAIAPRSNYPSIVPKIETDQISQQILLHTLPNIWSSFPQTSLPFGMDLAHLVVQPKAEPMVSPKEPDAVVECGTPISSSKLSLLGFSAYVQFNKTNQRTELVKIDNTLEKDDIDISLFYEKYPPTLRKLFENSENKDVFFLAKCWANIDVPSDVQNCQYAVDSLYSSREKFQLKVSTMACSFGAQAVEKIEQYFPQEVDGAYSFMLNNSPMCDYMVKFIAELKKLSAIETMNNVLENFTVLQIVTNSETDELLMVLCFVFEVSQEPEPSCSVYRLIDGGADIDC